MIDVRSVFAARDAMLTEGFVPEHLNHRVRPAILESWRRSMVSGATLSVSVRELEDLASPRTALRSAADPILSRLSERLSDLDTGVLLADHNAVILRRWVADNSILSLLDSVNSDVGFNISEDLVGTNGVGTVIETGRAIQISGPEHLATSLGTFTCVGAPVHHPITRRLEGVITLSCMSDASHPLLTPLLTSTAQDIEHRMLEQSSIRERLLLNAYIVSSKQKRAPIAAVGRDLFLAGPQVTELLRDVDQAMLWEYVRATASGSLADDSQFDMFREKFRVARCEAVESEGEVIGTIIEFEVPRRESMGSPVVAHVRSPAALPGKSASLAQTVAHATRLAASGQSMLIEGESGVGKLTLARAILESSDVDLTKIATVDVAASGVEGPTHFIQILRGHLTGKPATLLLRHLEYLSPETAAASAAVIEEFTTPDWTPRIVATFTVGSENPYNRPLLQRLVDVIGVGRVVIPPLRDRREDISEAASTFLKAHRGDRTLTLSLAALRVLMRAPWPGNLRQLDSTIRGVISTKSGAEIQIHPDDLPTDLQAHAQRRSLTALEELELNAILDSLRRHHGNKIAAANAIGISRSTLYRKLRSYHVDSDRQYF